MIYNLVLLNQIIFIRTILSFTLQEETCQSSANHTVKKLTLNCMESLDQNETFNFSYLKNLNTSYTIELTINNKNYY